MTARSRRYIALAFAAAAITAALIAGVADWPQAYRTIEFSGLMLVALLAAALEPQSPSATRVTMPPAFVLYCTALLLLGPSAFVVIATCGAMMQAIADQRRRRWFRQGLLPLLITASSAAAAGAVHQVSGGTTGTFVWPEQAVPIALAVLSYYLVGSAAAGIVIPLLTKQPITRRWPASILQGAPSYLVGATIAAAIATFVQQQMWDVVLAAALPLCFFYRGYCMYLRRVDGDERRREVLGALDHGMSAIDTDGLITFWSDELEGLLNCPRHRTLGRPLVAVLPALGKTELPGIIDEVMASGDARTLTHLSARSIAGGRTLQVRVIRVDDGIMLLWDNVTNRSVADQALKRSEERLALAAEGASDGLWEWDLRDQEFYSSSRWRSMLGIAGQAGVGSIADWLDRVHPEDRAELKAALDAHLAGTTDHCEHAHRIQLADGSYGRFECRAVAVRGPNGALRIAGSLTDVRNRAVAPGRPQGEGSIDPLTGLANRTVFVEGLGRRLTEFKNRTARNPFAALYLDLDRFKVVNDSLGHMVGDQLLTAVSRRLESCLRRGDSLARLGGDEFAILLNELGDANQANAIAFRIQEALSKPFSIDGREVFSSASIGIAFGHAQYNNPDDMMRDADTAMYHAKSRGKARHELFDADMHARELDRVGLENDLRRAVDAHDFEVHYQPIVLLGSGMCVGFESLARWTRNGKPVSPVTFIPLAEELGIIEPLGTWMLRQACATFADWKRRFPDAGLDYITVNVSSRQLMQQNFLWMVEQAVDRAGLKPCDLRLEITETALMDSPKEAAHLLHELREFGAKIYLDDFGCGYSSLSHLAKLPVDVLKIDRSFVKHLLLPDRPAIVESILALARTLNTGVVAEGIEHESQRRELERLGCTHAQGFLFSRPVPSQAAEAIIAANQPLGSPGMPHSGPLTGYQSSASGYSRPFQWPDELLPRKRA